MPCGRDGPYMQQGRGPPSTHLLDAHDSYVLLHAHLRALGRQLIVHLAAREHQPLDTLLYRRARRSVRIADWMSAALMFPRKHLAHHEALTITALHIETNSC